jgi:hypothetical protein
MTELKYIAAAMAPGGSLEDHWTTHKYLLRSTLQEDDICAASYATSGFNGTDDDTTAVLLARDALVERGRGRLILPQRTVLRQPLELPAPAHEVVNQGNIFEICGETDNGTVLFWKPTADHYGDDAITLTGQVNPSDNAWQGGGIRNLQVIAHSSVAANCTGAGIRLTTAWHASLYNVWAYQFAGAGGCGFRIGDDSQNTSLFHCHAIGCDIGYLIDFANDINFYGCKSNEHYSSCLKITRGFVMNWFGGNMQGSSTYVIHIAPESANYVQAVKFDGLYIETNAATILRHDTNSSTRFKWIGGHMASNDTSAVFFDFNTQPAELEMSLPACSPAGSQKVIVSTTGALIGVVSGGDAEVGQASVFNLHSESRILWNKVGDSLSFGPSPTSNQYSIDCGTWRGAFGLPRYTATQRLNINTSNISAGTQVYDTTVGVSFEWNGSAWYPTRAIVGTAATRDAINSNHIPYGTKFFATDLDAEFTWINDGETPPDGTWAEVTVVP